MAKIEIVLDRTGASYSAGETITGKAFLTLDKQVKCRSIKARLMGKEWTMFTRGRKHRVPYHGENKFFEKEVVLKEGGEIQPGTSEFPLTFTLPPQLPPSYNGVSAHIDYTLAVWADLPLWFDIQKEAAIWVEGGQPQANSTPLVISPQQGNARKPSFLINLRASRFHTGLSIEGTITAFNLQDSSVKRAVIRLLAVEDAAASNIVGTVHNRTIVRTSEITVPISEIAHGSTAAFYVPIPADSPPSFASKLSSIEWVLEASLDIPLWFDVKAKGTVTVLNRP